MRNLKVVWLFLLCFISGCVTTTPRPYDSTEYELSVRVIVDTTRAIHRCDNPSASNDDLWLYVRQANNSSLLLEEFLINKYNSDAFIPAVKQIREMINAVSIRGHFSSAYCVNKLTNIQAGSRILARALGRTDKFDMCEGGIKSRYDIFTREYNAKKMSASEYKELVNDVVKLQTVDTAGCDNSTHQKMLEELQLIEKALPAIMVL